MGVELFQGTFSYYAGHCSTCWETTEPDRQSSIRISVRRRVLECLAFVKNLKWSEKQISISSVIVFSKFWLKMQCFVELQPGSYGNAVQGISLDEALELAGAGFLNYIFCVFYYAF